MKILYKINSFLQKLLPSKYYSRIRIFLLRLYQLRLHVFTEVEIKEIITNFGIRNGDVVFIHSSINQFKTDFPFYKIIDILLEIVGSEGTLLFPCWQDIPDFNEYLTQEKVFNVKRTPTHLGLLPELARRRSDASRSLSPYNSVAAIGKKAHEMVKDHHLDPLSFSRKSPFYKLVENNGFILGLGVTTRYLSFVHCIEDSSPNKFPIQTRDDELSTMKVKTLDNTIISVNVKLPHENISHRDIPAFLKKHIPPEIAKDIKIKKTNFFIAKSNLLYQEMEKLAQKKFTIYS